MTVSYKIYLTGFRVFAILAFVFSAFGPWQITQVFADKPLVCAIPGKDGPVTLVNGVVNTYYPGLGNASSAIGRSISVGIPSGAAQTIQKGDLLLVIQMQGADIDSSNTGAYGDGVPGDPATGNLTSGVSNFTAGQYEYVVATNAVVAGSVSISSDLVNSYSTQNYPVGAGNQGQRRFQVIRVPQYSSATITATVTSLPWNGSVGGVVALDVAGGLTFSGGSINVNGQGFRGGGAVRATGGGGGANTDYRLPSSVPANSSKGEGTAGTPRYVFNGTTIVDFGALLEGYPNGTLGRGAPGNAGGGGMDGNQVANDENTGGGGGGNGGVGGKGGFAWNSIVDGGGFGGSAFTVVTPARLVVGGGGGAGTINDNDPILSSGGAGGGIVMVRAGTVTGNGSINANGLDGQDQPLFDSGGGAGAGGSVLVLAQNGALPATLNVNANGGNGGDAWLTQPPPGTTYPGERHGPGGGGGGGVIYLSSTAGTLSANGGTNGLTTTANDNYGSTPGSVGIINTGVTPSQTPNSISGPGCIPNPSVVKTTSTPSVVQTPTGTSGTYMMVVSIPADQGTALGFSISDTLPTGFTYNSTSSINLSGGATQPTTVNPTDPAAPAWGTFDIPGGGQVQITFTVNIAASVLPGTYQNPATAVYTDPTRTVPSGTTNRNYDPANPGEDITVTATTGPALTIVKSVTETSYTTVGAVLHYSYLVTNTGNVMLNAPFTVTDNKSTDEACPVTPTLAPAAFITCTATYTVTQADINAGNVTNIASAHGLFGTVPVDSPPDTKTVNYVAAPTADLSLTKTVNNSTPLIGATVTFTVTVTNVGPAPATGVQVGDILPAGFTFVSATPSTGTYTSGTGIWDIGALAVNASVNLTITATVNPTGPYVNSAQITASNQVDPDSIPNNNNPNEDDQKSVTVTPTQGSVTKNVDITSARIGEIVTYEVSVVIPSGTFNIVTLVDTMDRGLSFFACDGITAGVLTTSIVDPEGVLTPFQYICANPTVDSNGSADPVDVGRRVTFNFGTLTNAPGGTNQILTVTYRAVVLDSAGNQNGVNVRNSAQVSWTGSNNPPASSTVGIVEPDLSISKTSNNTFIANGTTVTFFITIQHTAASTADAYDVVVDDVLPTSLDFVTGSLDCTLGAQDPAPCTYDTVTRKITATWNTFARLGGTGKISFQATGNANLPANGSVTNVGSVAWTSLPGDLSQPQSLNQFSTERYYDPNDPNQINVFGASASINLSPLGGGGGGDKGGRGARNGGNAQATGGFLIPVTGFAPGIVTDLSGLPVARYDANFDLSLEIPRLKLNMPIVGAPLKNGAWDVNWLTNQAGWLEKTAFPGFPGNSVLTGHVTSSYGVAGPFASLHKLQEGDLIFIHTFGQTQIYKVRTVKKVQPNDISVLDHQEKPWLTLLTCANYDEKTNKYLSRVVVKAVLIEVRNGDINGQ